MSSAAPHRTSARSWPKWLPIVGWSLLAVLGTVLLVFIATVTFGAVHGTEFCPQTFERRSYSFYELPLVGWQVTGEQHEDLTGDTEKCITSSQCVPPPPPNGQPDWHVLVGLRGTRLRRPGDAGILVQYLDATDDGTNHRWKNWTEEHADLAKLLWPAVQRLALDELYVFVPDLFDLAKSMDDAALLRPAIDRTLAQKLLLLARRQLDRGNPAAALKTLDDAVALDPASSQIKEVRQTAVEQNESRKANAGAAK